MAESLYGCPQPSPGIYFQSLGWRPRFPCVSSIMNLEHGTNPIPELSGPPPPEAGESYYHYFLNHRMEGLVYDIPGLMTTQRLVLAFLVNKSKVKDGWRNYWSLSTIAKTLGLKKKTIANIFTRPAQKGWYIAETG